MSQQRSRLNAEIVVIPLSGWLAQVFSIRIYLLVNASLFMVFSAACALAQNLPQMIVLRAVQGFSGGVLIPMAFTLIITLLPKAKSEIVALTAFKHSQGDAGPLERWDYTYYENMLVKTRYQVNGQEVRQYFPIDHVISIVFGIYEKLLGVRFAEITPGAR